MARRTPRLLTAALGLAATLPACKDTPSFALRWDLKGYLDPTLDPNPPLAEEPEELDFEPILTAYQCSQVGVTAVRVRAIDEAGLPASDDVFPCFARGFDDPDVLVEGPQLKPGRYALEVRGVQRDLGSWIDEDIYDASFDDEGAYIGSSSCEVDADDLGCFDYDLVCDCQQFEAVEDETFTDFDRFQLTAPEDCIDGIDNDTDGLVDVEDPGCRDRPLQELVVGDCSNGIDDDADGRTDANDADCYIHEGGDVEIVQFTLTATALDQNPAATCDNVDITAIRITTGISSEETFDVATTACQLGVPLFFSAELPAIAEELSIFVTGLNQGEPVTIPVDVGMPVMPGSNAIIDLVVDFGEETFDPRLVKETEFFVAYSADPESEATVVSCEPGSGMLVIDQVSLQLLDLGGAPVAGATVSSEDFANLPLDGTPIPCAPSLHFTNPLEWGGYRLRGEAMAADGTVCFRSEDSIQLAPSAQEIPATLVLERVLVLGQPPPSCVDCTDGVDCDGELTCSGGICR